MKQDVIAVRGARVNNLKNVNIDIPKNQFCLLYTSDAADD